MNHTLKKYSKISPALKSCFLFNIYYHHFTIKQAANRSKINYSSAKIILKDLNSKQRLYIKRIVRMKQADSQSGKMKMKECCFNMINASKVEENRHESKIQVISRVGFDFFQEEKNGDNA